MKFVHTDKQTWFINLRSQGFVLFCGCFFIVIVVLFVFPKKQNDNLFGTKKYYEKLYTVKTVIR